MNSDRIMSIVLSIAALASGIGTVYLILWRTSPAGLQVQQNEHEERMQKLRNEAAKEENRKIMLLAQHNQSVSSPTLAARTPVQDCIDVDSLSATRSNPVEASGACLKRNHNDSNTWIRFSTIPKQIDGNIVFSEFIDNRTVAYCKTSETSDRCAGFLQARLGIPLVVFNSGPVRIL